MTTCRLKHEQYHQTLVDGGVQLSLEEVDDAARAIGLVPQPTRVMPEPCAYRPEPFPAHGGAPSSFLRVDTYMPTFGVYRLEEGKRGDGAV